MKFFLIVGMTVFVSLPACGQANAATYCANVGETSSQQPFAQNSWQSPYSGPSLEPLPEIPGPGEPLIDPQENPLGAMAHVLESMGAGMEGRESPGDRIRAQRQQERLNRLEEERRRLELARQQLALEREMRAFEREYGNKTCLYDCAGSVISLEIGASLDCPNSISQ